VEFGKSGLSFCLFVFCLATGLCCKKPPLLLSAVWQGLVIALSASVDRACGGGFIQTLFPCPRMVRWALANSFPLISGGRKVTHL